MKVSQPCYREGGGGLCPLEASEVVTCLGCVCVCVSSSSFSSPQNSWCHKNILCAFFRNIERFYFFSIGNLFDCLVWYIIFFLHKCIMSQCFNFVFAKIKCVKIKQRYFSFLPVLLLHPFPPLLLLLLHPSSYQTADPTSTFNSPARHHQTTSG